MRALMVAISVDDIAKLLESSSKLGGVLAWPALLCFVLVRHGKAMGEFFDTLSEISINVAGGGVTAKRYLRRI